VSLRPEPLGRQHLALLLLAGALGGCAAGDAAEAPEQPPERPAAARLGEAAPEFRTVTLAGDTVSLAALRGRVVLVHAWAIWCTTCVTGMPALRELHRRYADAGLTVVGLHTGSEGLGRARTFLRMFDIDYPQSVERWDRADALLGVRQGLPRSMLVDRRGMVVRRWIGPMQLEEEMLEAVLDDRHELTDDGALRWRPRS
jgi:peroxiredoxin